MAAGSTGGDDARWLAVAARLAQRSLGRTWPNPGVGCVLVRDGVLLGGGRHERCGGPHAEIHALADTRARGYDPAGATAYVTLAPCTRHGRTPPCVEALVAARVARVVAACADPHQDDAGARLAVSGIAYAIHDDGLGRHLHGGFLSRVTRGRPRVTGKWGMTLDGCIAARGEIRGVISPPDLLALSRRRRRAFDAILVGGGTVAADDPALLAATAGAAGPVRVVVARRPDPAWFAAGRRLRQGSAPLWLVTAPGGPAIAGVEHVTLNDPHDPAAVLAALGQRGINELLVEGGARLHAAWLAAGVYDRLELSLSWRTLGGGVPVVDGPGPLSAALGGDWLPEESPRVVAAGMLLRCRRGVAPG
jgi:diaminohydroxyphosphoribosylaminopyrimidine deaminase/5-amino-6-(5-phosphoribosylamino)uracil reductase